MGSKIIRYDFDTDFIDREVWRTYDYNGGVVGGGNVFYPVSWENSGGVNNSAYIWADDSRWRIDTPEQPHSILAFIIYQNWHTPGGVGQPQVSGKGPSRLDLREATVSVYLRSDGLNLKGANLYFWILGAPSTRWHYTGFPLEISTDEWGDKVEFRLKNDDSLWHRTWSGGEPANLDQALGQTISYGFSFIGFREEVTGRFAMDEFELRLAPSNESVRRSNEINTSGRPERPRRKPTMLGMHSDGDGYSHIVRPSEDFDAHLG